MELFLSGLKTTTKFIIGIPLIIVLSVTIGLLTSVMVAPVVEASGTLAEGGDAAIAAIEDDLEIPELSQKSYLYASDGTLLTTFYAQNRVVVPLEEISQAMQDAVVALEDRRFWEHSGVDTQGMLRAFLSNATGGDVQGASTITQQYVKNVLIEKAVLANDQEAAAEARETSYARKLREAKMAIALEKKAGKTKILEGYLNIAQFGPSQWGVESAANYYFGVHASQLTVVQAATIAAVTQSPNGLDPVRNPAKNKVRRDLCLDWMLKEGYITQAEHDWAVKQDVTATLHVTNPQSGCEVADRDEFARSGYFCDFVLSTLRNSEDFGNTQAEREALLYRGGLHVYTTIDLDMQQDAVNAIEQRIPTDDPSGVGHALTAIEPGTGKIKAMAQNRHYKLGEPEGRSTSVNYNTDKVDGGSSGFQAGSTFKPIILADWLIEGHSLREPFDAARTDYKGTYWKAEGGCLPDGSDSLRVDDWKFRGSAKGFVDAYQATQSSINSAYVAMEYKLDLCKIQEVIEAMGIHRADGDPWLNYPSQVLGTNEVAPMTMAAAYATFAAGGVYCTPIAIERITDPDGNSVPVPKANCHQAIESDVAAGVTSALVKVVQGGTGTQARIEDGRPTAGKTGTTDDSMAAWFCGFTPQLATAIWAGFPDRSEPLENIRIADQYWSSTTGGGLPGVTFRWFMSAALEGAEVLGFPEVPSIMERGVPLEIPDVLGQTDKAAEDALEKAGFYVKWTAESYSDAYAAGTVASQSPTGEAYLGTTITLSLSMGPEPPPPPTPTPTPTPTPSATPTATPPAGGGTPTPPVASIGAGGTG
ncbi:MAG: transglycosylase domain-containing protein [Bifidobacteriaceae bacterium]|nr:transglycosylase domain-containing protein [Bifidobacteriaceae bacterium]